MSLSKRSHEGYLMLDNRASPVPDAVVHNAGLPAGAGRGFFEAPTYTCSHCQRVVVLNPLRNRERAYCTGCDHYICDGCGTVRAALGGRCRTFKQLVDEVQEAATLGQEITSSIILKE